MNIAERIIALDEKLDEVILSRGERLADELNFEQQPDDQKRRLGAGAAMGGLAVGGAVAGGGMYGASVNRRLKANRAVASSGYGKAGPTSVGGMMKQDIGSAKSKAVEKAGAAYNNKKVRKARAAGLKMKRKGLGRLKALRKTIFETMPEDTIEFMYTSGGEYGNVARGQAKAAKNTSKERLKRKMKVNKYLAMKKAKAMPRSAKIAGGAGLGAAALTGAVLARRKKD